MPITQRSPKEDQNIQVEMAARLSARFPAGIEEPFIIHDLLNKYPLLSFNNSNLLKIESCGCYCIITRSMLLMNWLLVGVSWQGGLKENCHFVFASSQSLKWKCTRSTEKAVGAQTTKLYHEQFVMASIPRTW